MRKTLHVFLSILAICCVVPSMANAQAVYTFTSCGATGSVGPSQTQINTAYASTNLAGMVNSSLGIQKWAVPVTGTYRIEAFGGQGYGPFGGRGAHITGEFALTAGDTLKILVGQMAGHYFQYPGTSYNHQFGGGGGSFVTTYANSPLVVAGGGGGNHAVNYLTGCDGQITTNGANGAQGTTSSAGGTNGNGGNSASSADAGGGLLTNGAGTAGGKSFLNGGGGGNLYGFGGFGGGGGTSSWNNYRGGGGGGYSGGGAGNNGGSCCAAGGGGGSFNGGLNPVALAGVQIGDGMVIITNLSRPMNDAGVDKFTGFAPPVCAGTYPVEVMVRNYGSNQITSVNIDWSVNGVMQTQAMVSTTIDTIGGTGADSLAVTLGNVNITTATTIRAWTTQPNAVQDSTNDNDTLEIMIAAPAVVTAALDNDVACFDGLDGGASATTVGGSPTYSYLWSNGATTAIVTGLGAGMYSVTVTDNDGCTHSDSVTISQPTALEGMETVTDISCNGETDGQIVVSPMGGTPGYTIAWNGGSTSTVLDSLSAGTYTYTLTDSNGCTYVDSVSIIEPSALAASGSVTDETTGQSNGAIDLTVSGGTPNYSFLWSNGATTEDLTGLAAGTYSCTVTDGNGCTEVLNFTVGSIVAVDPSASFLVDIYPNPNSGTFKVALGNVNASMTIEVMDIVGNRIRQISQVGATTEINLNEGAGVYIVRISNGNESVTRRVVITQ